MLLAFRGPLLKAWDAWRGVLYLGSEEVSENLLNLQDDYDEAEWLEMEGEREGRREGREGDMEREQLYEAANTLSDLAPSDSHCDSPVDQQAWQGGATDDKAGACSSSVRVRAGARRLSAGQQRY